MAKFYTALDDKLKAFIAQQRIFFTGSAPVEGRVNVSPKGMDSFRVLDDTTVAYLDVTGSGNETSAHIEQNGRLTIMMCSFDEVPTIFRMYGRGEVIRLGDARWAEYHRHFPDIPGQRQIIVLHIESAQTSCGFGVPLYMYAGERGTLVDWAEKRGDTMEEYRQNKNLTSIDGLPTGWPRK